MSDLAADLKQAVETYFDGLYFGDVERFRKVFHPAARLFSATEGKLVALDLEQYLALVAGRPSPAARGDRRADEIVASVIASPTTAHVRVKDLYLPKQFTDELVFVRLDGRWQLISKVWHFEMQ